MSNDYNIIKELADMHNKAIGKHQFILAKMPKRKSEKQTITNKIQQDNE